MAETPPPPRFRPGRGRAGRPKGATKEGACGLLEGEGVRGQGSGALWEAAPLATRLSSWRGWRVPACGSRELPGVWPEVCQLRSVMAKGRRTQKGNPVR